MGKSNIALHFKSADHFNNMIDGKANPIPTKGITKIGFLKNEFTALTNNLSFYLKPTEELLKDNVYKKINTFLTANVAFAALAEIGNHDETYKGIAKSIPDGVVKIYIENEELQVFLKCNQGKLEKINKYEGKVRAYMKFKDIETANGVLNGSIDSYTAIALEKLEISGHMGMIDNINKILFVVPRYLI